MRKAFTISEGLFRCYKLDGEIAKLDEEIAEKREWKAGK
jgi:hypothetical protein